MDDTTMDSYNENTSLIRASQIPSRIPSPNKGIGLVEISASATNSRTMSGMAPPEAGGLKYKTLAHPEAGPKRKTLAERAGEVSQVKLPAPPSSRPFSSSVRATALSGVRNPSFSSSVSATRNPLHHSRNVSTSSFASSVGPGVHPPSTQSLRRPQTSYGSVRSAMPVPTISSRPASSMDTRVTNPTSTLGKRKGMKFHNSVNLNVVGLYNVNELCDVIERSPAFGHSSTSSRRPRSSRDISLTSAMNKLNSEAEGSPPSGSSNLFLPKTPSKKKSPCSPITPLKVTKSRSSPKKVYYLTRDSNTPGAPTVLEDEREPRREWNTQARLDKMENMYNELQKAVSGTADERNSMTETINLFKAKIHELEEIRSHLSAKNATLTAELSNTKECLSKMTTAGDDERRSFRSQTDEQRRQHLADIDNAKREARDEVDRLIKLHHEELYDLERRLKNELADERSRRVREVQEAEALGSIERRKADTYIESKDQEVHNLKFELQKIQGALDGEKLLQKNLQENLTASSTENVTLKSELRGLRARIDFLESDSSAQAQSFTDLEQRMQDAIAASKEAMEKLRKEETLRRKLHNQVQELKGNIRVFCRVRPPLEIDSSSSLATIAFPNDEVDAKEVEVQGPEEKSSLGTITTKKHPFSFDRVFGPNSENQEIFEEISQLVQSALDGYNVCIFCYGQTGSGKTHTMSAEDGMIPRAVHQIYETAVSLEEKGWTYTMEGSFVEVYNENLNDLLGKAGDLDNGKLDIRHDPQTRKTWVTGLQSKTLDSPDKVHEILRKASKNRSVAATKANERSSRSHSVFILKLQGHNAITGESSEGTLNLVDLAGSERLSHSGATGDRLKETQNINRSLSCLGDVIGALGRGREGGHIPYRNSKLTELLQYSLGGNSKTLMFVMISPLQAHLSETLTSLKFATKVHNTHIGTAKKQSKVRD